MTRPDDPTRSTAEPPEPITPPTRKERTMFSPDTLRTLDAIGFPLDPIERHDDDPVADDDPDPDAR